MSEELVASIEVLGLAQVGQSVLGRPLRAGCWGTPGAASVIVVVGGVHGDEASSVVAALDLLEDLRVRPPGDSAVWVLPALNPDGVAAGTKDSGRGVDLNRNFPARSFRVSHPAGYFPGDAPLSEPETRALAALLDRVGQVAGVVALHAPLRCINHDGPAAPWAEQVAAASGWPARADIGYPTPGSLGSWLGRDRGIPVLTIELPAGPYDAFRDQARSALQTAINPEKFR